MKKYISIFCAMMFAIVCLSGCFNSSNKLTGEEIFAKLSPSTVEIHVKSDYKSGFGTGFFIDTAGTIVTNYHVIKDCSEAYIITNENKKYDVYNVLGYSEELDIAILSTKNKDSKPVVQCPTVVTGETIYVLGSSLGLTETFSDGIISAAQRNDGNVSYIQISAPISQGNSGGPVVNEQGQVVGIAKGTIISGQNLNLAIPITMIEQIPVDNPITMEEFFETTSAYANLDDRVVVHGSMLAIRTITLEDRFTAEYILTKWKNGDANEVSMIEIMDEFGASQGGGQLYIIDPEVFVEEIDAWCFDPDRRLGDYAIIENALGYSICYISMLNNF